MVNSNVINAANTCSVVKTKCANVVVMSIPVLLETATWDINHENEETL